MKILWGMALLGLAASASAAPTLITAPSADASVYTPIVVDSKKLAKSGLTLRAALEQFPGKEILMAEDINAAVIADTFVARKAYSYNMGSTLAFPKEPKSSRIDGLKVEWVNNFRVITNCFNLNPCVAPPPQVVTVSPTAQVIEWGMTLVAGRDGQLFTESFDISVNGVFLGNVPVVSSDVFYIGVADPDGVGEVTITPRIGNLTGAWVANKFFVK